MLHLALARNSFDARAGLSRVSARRASELLCHRKRDVAAVNEAQGAAQSQLANI